MSLAPATPLRAAVRAGDAEAARGLLAAGAPLSDAPGCLPLLCEAAARGSGDGHCAVAELLLDAGADPNEVTEGETALTRACGFREHLDMVSTLLRRGADVDAGRPLARACGFGAVEAAELLLRHGAEPMHVHYFGLNRGTPLEIVARVSAGIFGPFYPTTAMATLLLRYGATLGGGPGPRRCAELEAVLAAAAARHAQGPGWSISAHGTFPLGYRRCVLALFLAAARLDTAEAPALPRLPHELWHCVAAFCARGWFPPHPF